MTVPAAARVHGSHIAELGRQAALPYRGTPHPLARSRHAAGPRPRVVPARPALVDELFEAVKNTHVAPILVGLFVGGFLVLGLAALLGLS